MHKSGQAGPSTPFLEPGNETLFATNFVKYLVALFLLLSLIYHLLVCTHWPQTFGSSSCGIMHTRFLKM